MTLQQVAKIFSKVFSSESCDYLLDWDDQDGNLFEILKPLIGKKEGEKLSFKDDFLPLSHIKSLTHLYHIKNIGYWVVGSVGDSTFAKFLTVCRHITNGSGNLTDEEQELKKGLESLYNKYYSPIEVSRSSIFSNQDDPASKAPEPGI